MAVPKRPKAKPKPKRAAPLPFHNIVTPEMADRHAVHLKATMDRQAAESAANYHREYDAITGRAHQGGANAQKSTAMARRHFAFTHGAQHLPK